MAATRWIIRGAEVHVGPADIAPFRADVAVSGDRIEAVGPDLPTAGAEVLDAEGRIVCPGFVDIHSHGDMTALTVPDADSKVTDGVTSELAGNCGLTPFPTDGEGGMADFAAFAEAVEAVGSGINRAFLVGHNALRRAVMGEEDRPPRPEELAEMKARLDRAIAQGALGLSSGLGYAPGCFAPLEELVELTRVVAETGGLYATHIRNEGDRVIESVDEAIETARRSGCRLQIGHLKTLGRENWPKVDVLEDRLRSALAEGVDVAADRYPYLACSTGLRALFSPWLMDGGPARATERLRDPSCRRRLREDAGAEFRGEGLWEAVVVSGLKGPANQRLLGSSLADIARDRGRDELETALDLLVEEETAVSVFVFAMSEANLARILNWPFVMVGSDASAKSLDPPSKGMTHPRTFGTFACVLGRLVREQGVLELDQAIEKMTSRPARRMGLRERGEVREGWFADLTVFDPARVTDRATYEDPWRTSEGIRHVLVNGEPVLRDGEMTGLRPGRILRSAPTRRTPSS